MLLFVALALAFFVLGILSRRRARKSLSLVSHGARRYFARHRPSFVLGSVSHLSHLRTPLTAAAILPGTTRTQIRNPRLPPRTALSTTRPRRSPPRCFRVRRTLRDARISRVAAQAAAAISRAAAYRIGPIPISKSSRAASPRWRLSITASAPIAYGLAGCEIVPVSESSPTHECAERASFGALEFAERPLLRRGRAGIARQVTTPRGTPPPRRTDRLRAAMEPPVHVRLHRKAD